ncbi:head-to-tail stopper [Mycobacterium phage prophiGD91-2]|uniref:hypothetical protein n=1 Tax=Mycobacteroides abscessus TaxID=36809 RepID=UPI00092A1BBD|nr:hypothetical protein [Mycobacteroides abscessus]QSM03943.1 head-to-tail stopper [Mycobacterium phage prophiGD91-2]QSM90540.1 hypothetical protein I3U44_07685 [Mycobacteroides abscessus subsp. bolletii]QSM90824.1 hypothetical protein I3U44_09320 [Mycobacteroides abscessus subsp. bolletii]SIJ01205.1 Uncharacterised protein [Mycobacteroides abscessus subsp. bolletii]SLD36617.1 Uncharacterised protein [Mycobacteroides abscessus subsp. bolletii]
MSFGGQTVAFVMVNQTGQPGWGGLKATSRSMVPLSGCRFRLLSSTETPETQTDVTTEVWKLTAPPEVSALAVKANGQLVYDGTDHPELVDLDSPTGRAATFQIDGPIAPKFDMGGPIEHVTIICKRQVG